MPPTLDTSIIPEEPKSLEELHNFALKMLEDEPITPLQRRLVKLYIETLNRCINYLASGGSYRSSTSKLGVYSYYHDGGRPFQEDPAILHEVIDILLEAYPGQVSKVELNEVFFAVEAITLESHRLETIRTLLQTNNEEWKKLINKLPGDLFANIFNQTALKINVVLAKRDRYALRTESAAD